MKYFVNQKQKSFINGRRKKSVRFIPHLIYVMYSCRVNINIWEIFKCNHHILNILRIRESRKMKYIIYKLSERVSPKSKNKISTTKHVIINTRVKFTYNTIIFAFQTTTFLQLSLSYTNLLMYIRNKHLPKRVSLIKNNSYFQFIH